MLDSVRRDLQSGIQSFCLRNLNKTNSNSTQDLLVKEKMESQSETSQTVSALKLLVLKTREYDLWIIPVASTSVGAEGPIPPKTTEQKLARKNELKAKRTLMLAIPDEHLLKFHDDKVARVFMGSNQE
ncbi:hypothetical protein Tco_0435197 [Tanacetum coccineum]